MDMPKALLCCEQKPSRTFYQMGYRDDEGHWVFTCKERCGRKVTVKNLYRGIHQAEAEAVSKWNSLIREQLKERYGDK